MRSACSALLFAAPIAALLSRVDAVFAVNAGWEHRMCLLLSVDLTRPSTRESVLMIVATRQIVATRYR